MEKKPTKIAALSLASVLAVSLAMSPTAAFAKNDHGKEASVKEGSNNKKDKGVTSSTEDSSTKNNVDETSSTESDQQSGTDQEKKKGLYNALEKVKNTPAEETISNLISSKYKVEEIIDSLVQVSGSQVPSNLTSDGAIPGDKEIEAVADEIRKGHKEGKYQISSAGLTQLADVYDQLNQPAEALDTQEQAIAENPTDMEGYKKLAKLKKKAGQKGLQAFVDGETVPSDVQPLFAKGRAMVPFRAISAALKAKVEYKDDGTIIVSRDAITIELKVGSTTALVWQGSTALGSAGYERQ